MQKTTWTESLFGETDFLGDKLSVNVLPLGSLLPAPSTAKLQLQPRGGAAQCVPLTVISTLLREPLLFLQSHPELCSTPSAAATVQT